VTARRIVFTAQMSRLLTRQRENDPFGLIARNEGFASSATAVAAPAARHAH